MKIEISQKTYFIRTDKQGNYLENLSCDAGQELHYNDTMYIIEPFTEKQDFIDRLATFNITFEEL